MDQRSRSLDARERAVEAREARVGEQESRQAERRAEVDHVLSVAARRDEAADARDWAAAERDMAANVHAWSGGDQGCGDAEARQEALDDRLHSYGDRAASAVDRFVLSDVAHGDARRAKDLEDTDP